MTPEELARDNCMPPMDKLLKIIEMLRSPGGCPWDREQTFESLKKPTIEESCELICGVNEYSESKDASNMKEELGDMLLQILLYSEIAKEQGLFDFGDVIEVLTDKMIRRHPHVFGEMTALDSEEALRNWEAIKTEEKLKKKDVSKESLGKAFDEAEELINAARQRKNI